MAAVKLQAAELTEGLRAKLSSSLPLEARCRLATNSFTCRVAIPHKETVVLDWLLETLDQKYRDRHQPPPSLSPLWQCLSSCLSLLPLPGLQYDLSGVPDFLLNVLPQASITSCPHTTTSISLLLPLAAASCPTSPSWLSLLAATLPLPSLLLPSLAALASLPLAKHTAVPASLLSALCSLYTSHPQHQAQLLAITSQLLFSRTADFAPFFQHLVTEDLEEKFLPSGPVSVFLSCLEAGSDPRLLAAAGSTSSSLSLPLLSLTSFLCGAPCSSLNPNTAVGARLQAAVLSDLDRLAAVFCSCLPLPDLAAELVPGQAAGKFLQDLVRHAMGSGAAGPALCSMVTGLHQHHPQLLEALAPSLLTAHLEAHTSPSLLSPLLQVMLALRQLPKLLSRLFLHLRSLPSLPPLSWGPGDLEELAAALPSLPRVQALEMWKSLNYHLASDCLGENKDQAATVSALLGPLLATLLTGAQLADQALPSSLLPRVRELSLATLASLEEVLQLGFLPPAHRSLLFLVTSALGDLVSLLQQYRADCTLGPVLEFRDKVAVWLLDNTEYTTELGAAQLLRSYYTPGRTASKILEAAVLEEEGFLPHVFDTLPEEVLLRWARTRGGGGEGVSPCLAERPLCCALVILVALERVNRGCEELYIPSPEVWLLPDNWSSLEGYLGKSLSSTLVALLHSEVPPSSLEEEDRARLASLPLEHLPPALKLGASLAVLSQVFRGPSSCAQFLPLAARCLETTEVFRFLDTGVFLARVLALQEDTADLVQVLTDNVVRHAKTLQDVERGFPALEDCGDRFLGAAVKLITALAATMGECREGSDKKVAGEVLADRLSSFILGVFKARRREDTVQLDLLLEAAAGLVTLFSAKGLGKLAKMVGKLVGLAFSSPSLASWRLLLAALCRNLHHLDPALLPEGWRSQAWALMASSYTVDCSGLVSALLASASCQELEKLLSNHQGAALDLRLWGEVVKCPLEASCNEARNRGVEAAVVVVLQQAGEEDFTQGHLLPGFIEALLSCSPPCLPPQLEALCLGCLALAPLTAAPSSLSCLTTFLSCRSSLSTRCIPLISSLLRHLLPSLTSLPALRSLQSLLGLFSRHPADWASVTPDLVADLLQPLPSLSPPCRAALTTAILPLLPHLDKHGREYLAAHLPPATNEVFRHLLETYNTHHKFKGRV